MPIYEYQGQEYDIATTDHAEAKRKILAYLQRATAEDRASQVPSLANIQPQIQPSRNPSLIERIVGGLETGATIATSALSMPAAAVGGFVEGMRTSAPKIGTPEHNRMVEERARQIQQGMTYQPKTETGKEYLQTLGKAMQESKIPPYVPMPGFQPNLVKPAIQEAGQIARSTAAIPKEIVTGVKEGIRNPTWQPSAQTAFVPLGETYYPQRDINAWRRGDINLQQLEASQVPSSSLFQTTGQQLSRQFVPTTEQGQPLMPMSGKAMQSTAEQFARDLINRPQQAGLESAVGAALGSIIGGPTGAALGAIVRPAVKVPQMWALSKLAGEGNFDPNFAKQLALAKTMENAGINKAAGPVIPENMVAAQGGRPEPRLNLPDQQPVQQPTVQPAVPAQPQPVQQAPQTQPVQQPAVQPVNPVESIYTQATQAGLTKDDLRKTVVATRAQQIVKEQKDAGLVVDKKTSQNLAAREADAYLAKIEERTRAARQVERERIEAEKRAAFEATPEGKEQLVRTQEIDAALAADPGLKPFLDEQRMTGSGRDRAIASQDVWDDIKQRRQREIEQANRPKESKEEIQAKIKALRKKPISTEEKNAAKLEKQEQQDEKPMRVMGKITGGSSFETGKTSEQQKTTGMSTALQERLKQMQASGNYKPPKGLMEMKTGNLPEFPNKQEFKKQEMIDKLAGRITEGTYVDNGLRYEVSAIDYGNAPKELLERLNKPLTQVRVISEKTGKQVSGPVPETPAKSIRQQVEEKLNKRK